MLGKYNKEWHENGIMFFCIFTIIMSLYSAFNLSVFFVADFFKNNIISAWLFSHDAFTNIFDSIEGVCIFLFFTLKIVLAMFVMIVKSNIKRLFILSVLFLCYAVEGILSIGGNCMADNGSLYGCGFNHVINPLASLIMMTFFLIIIIKQLIIAKKEIDYLDEPKIADK